MPKKEEKKTTKSATRAILHKMSKNDKTINNQESRKNNSTLQFLINYY